MGDTTRFLSAISSPELSDARLNLPDEQLSPEELERKRRKTRYRQEFILRVYPESIRRRLLKADGGASNPESEAELNAIIDAGLYVLASIEDKSVAPKCGDEVRRLIHWKKKWLVTDAARSRQRTNDDISLEATESADGAGIQVADVTPDSDPALVVEVAELCQRFIGRLTARQRDIVQLLIQGQDVAEIAISLDATPRSIYGERDRLRLIWREFTKDMTSAEFHCILDPLLDTIMETTPK